MVAKLFGTRHRLQGRQFFHGRGQEDGLGVIQEYYIQVCLQLCVRVPNRPGPYRSCGARRLGNPELLSSYCTLHP